MTMHPLQRIRGPIILALLCAACLCPSCKSDTTSIPVTEWSILYDDEPSLEKIGTGSDWRPFSIPSTFRLPSGSARGLQHAWLKGAFNMPGDPSAYHGISLGRIYYTDSVYVNGMPVGSSSPGDISIMCRSRSYEIPPGVLARGANTVHVRIGIFANEYGGILSTVTLQDRDSFSRARFVGDLVYIYLPMAVIIVSFFAFIVLAIFYLWNRTEKQYLYSSFGVIVYFFYIASLFYPFHNLDFLVIKFMHAATVQFFSIALILIIQSIYGIYITNYNRVLVPGLLAAVVLNFLGFLLVYRADIPFTHYTGDALGILTICFNVPLAVALTVRLNRLKPDGYKFWLSLFSSVGGGLVILVEVILSMTGGRFTFLLATFCSPVFFLLFVVLFARELTKKNAEINHLYDRLKAGEPVISETTQEKLEKIIQFIKENYTSDLSREGLAAAVGLNPNYMSTLFKKYTGYKINDYINKLRIEDAAAKLSEKDEKIIEIAFAVGFESLTTFNRVFKSVVGKTPTEYREMA
ncbi:MAG TPA: helix-turn-helix domain-containing protein [Spirochaetota bacterium]|nr:helix-turn-helix domain-containing protein [Spirochaetota bacterium]